MGVNEIHMVKTTDIDCVKWQIEQDICICDGDQ